MTNTTKIQAEIARLDAERDFFLANAEVARTLAEQEAIGLRVRQRAEAEVLARDEYHFVYLFDDDVDDDSVKECIHQLNAWVRNEPGCDIEIQLDTSGGSIFAGFKLIDFIRDLRSRGHKVTIVVYGHAASMGAVILQAADVRVMGQNAFLLLHEGSMYTGGDYGSIQDDVKLFKKLHNRILQILSGRASVSKETIKRGWQRTDWWLDAEESLERGLVDEVR